MTVVDSRRSPARPPERGGQLPVVEPGLSPGTTRWLALGLVAIGVVVGSVLGDPHGAPLRAAFLAACLLGALLGRPSGLRRLLRTLPLAWVAGLLLASVGALLFSSGSDGVSLRTVVLDTGSGLVLLAPWLWLGWGLALALTWARGGLRRA